MPAPIHLRSSSGDEAEASFLRERLTLFGRIAGGLSVVFYPVVLGRRAPPNPDQSLDGSTTVELAPKR